MFDNIESIKAITGINSFERVLSSFNFEDTLGIDL